MGNFNMWMILETSHPYLTGVITSHSPGGRHAIWTAVWDAGLLCLCMYYFHLRGKHREVGTTSNASSQGPRNTPNTTGAQEVFTGDRWYVGARRPGEHLSHLCQTICPTLHCSFLGSCSHCIPKHGLHHPWTRTSSILSSAAPLTGGHTKSLRSWDSHPNLLLPKA